ncbi:hypothetical protein A2Y85_04690 [candidate division WOR-3 bacterium RBG_13_43_14]|uniref:DUF401 family protein n=1 Tax=candidate division WOR-3 bacterium RBG_13_43_14 TaxID=1802590 RepID=A0A1F4UBY3_UNCW3|nr:MAG: hypothetical protein A2Y85_04690 [candidate division WOR-3 bacterium RBG_13_43_14]
MLIIIRILIAIILLVVLIRRKVNLALALLLDAVAVGLLFRTPAFDILTTFPRTMIQLNTLEFLFIIYMVLVLAQLMRASGNLDRIILNLDKLFADYRIGAALLPALIGLLPMPAGAMLSAPIVREMGNKASLSSEKMTFLNYWFRHLWEYFWPLYPAILLTAGIFDISLRSIMITQFPLTFAALFVGLIFLLRLPRIKVRQNPFKVKILAKTIFYLWPVLTIIFLVMVLKFRMAWSLGVSVTLSVLFSRLPIKTISSLFVKAFSISSLGVIYAVFVFKNMLDLSGALAAIPQIVEGLPAIKIFVIFFAPFIVGFLTGVNSAFAGIAFPIIAPLATASGAPFRLVMFAYASGFAGVLLSPVHLCLCLTKEYFGADFPKVYRFLLPSVLMLFVISIVLLLIYRH